MPQATLVQDGEQIDYTPGTAKSAGDVVVVGNYVGVCNIDIAANVLGALSTEGVFDFSKVTGAIADGENIYWNPTGSPVGGVASSGAAQNTGGTGCIFLGAAIKASASGDATARVLRGRVRHRMATATVAAAGSVQADAAAIGEGLTLVSAADATKGVLLPAASPGMQVFIKNGAAAILKIWPATGDGINAIAVNSAFSVASLTACILVAYDATTWYSFPLVAS